MRCGCYRRKYFQCLRTLSARSKSASGGKPDSGANQNRRPERRRFPDRSSQLLGSDGQPNERTTRKTEYLIEPIMMKRLLTALLILGDRKSTRLNSSH